MITLLGWIGALLALAAYAQTRTIRLRQIALLSSVAPVTFALLLGIWSNVALETALGIVNLRRLVQLRQPVGSSGQIPALAGSGSRQGEWLSRVRRAARPRQGRQPAGPAPTGRTTGLARPNAG